ncbi:hypothetical protein LQZ24_04255 [Fructobacillus sp. M1-13]|uniref:DUF1761 domain-containing protein n=1 Tax=Fructobacillus papyriferae TaxID=2713171 RepID=A0ABS5QRC0_9LACO|nr:hypothetical protein [Fructobacillus papyriferae]MBS9335467.1 hypothetical protein [Fructobacillus papyriferae]MCD2159237.1 hypothetical protein [Fructobacillus papyriferae]
MLATIIFNALWVGFLGGILASLVRIGFQQLFRTEEAKKTEALSIGGGVFLDFSQAAFVIGSIILSIVFIIWANYDATITQGSGMVWGFIVWVGIEQVYQVAKKKHPFFWHLPWQKTAVEIVGFLLWGWTMYLVAIGLPISGVYF